ncbi:probable inactive receptor kinase At5g16590 isoform X1 [Oryza glaberrima]|uniref:probable inactive receptor kinase At5g16590 isoform X1 n=1 Tax=Oryza glaberrima TaxID=4538 RepID=UPI00224BFEA9|nr:probable inactive receptor kinase At5g16590 isoform X1 [Oryza glaberrima]
MIGTRCETTWVWVVMVVVVILAAAMAAVVEGVGSPEPELEALRDERGGLVALRDALRSGRDLHSNWTGPPCHGGRSRWYGVACDGDGRVVGVQLDGAQLTGALPAGALAGVARLETLSLRDNAIHGALPRLDALARLRVVDLSSNRFSGPIPRGYAAALGELTRLELQDNLINGTLPAFEQDGLAVFNVSYNFLQGEVPDTRALRRFPATAFAHNLRLCGEVVRTECRREGSPFDAAPAGGGGSGSGSDGGDRVFGARDAAAPPARWRKPIRFRIARWSVVVIALIAALVPFAAVLIFLHHSKKSRVVRLGGGRAAAAATAVAGDIKDKAAEQAGKKVSSGSGNGSRSTTESGKGAADQLQFFRPEKATFSLDELFRSTAEMLGKGRLGITYRVALHAAGGGGPVVVVVKRLRNMGHVPRKDFAHTMQLLGKLRHENVVEVVACYFSKDEKLVVYDHVPGRSLFHLLHENRGEGRTPLPWLTRLAIAKGVARGLAYLHQTLPLFHRPPHGDLKSSNVLVVFPGPGGRGGGGGDAAPVAKLTDHGFHPLLPHHAHRLAAAKCPELARGRRRLSSRADVFCLGLVLLEVVTGKVPVDEDGDLAEWARLALSHEWSTDILDVEIVADRGRHGDMLRLTEVALLCAAVDPERRPKAHDVVRMIDDIAAGSAAAAGDGEATAGRELALR